MSSNTGNSLEKSNETTDKSSFKSDELICRTNELKESLFIWRHIVLLLNNLLEWQHTYDPFIIFGTITFIFFFILQTNPPILTFVSFVIIVMVLIDLLAPVGIYIVFQDENLTSTQEAKYTILCEHMANIEQYIKHRWERVLEMRKEQPTMYLIIGSVLLGCVAFASQLIDNLLLSYLITLTLCLIPGIYSRQLISLANQHIIHFWANKGTILSNTNNSKKD